MSALRKIDEAHDPQDIHDADSRRLKTLSLKSFVNALGLIQCYLLARIHTLHSFGQQGLICGIIRLRTVLQISRSEEALLVCHPVNAGLDFHDTH